MRVCLAFKKLPHCLPKWPHHVWYSQPAEGHSRQQRARIPVVPHPHQDLMLSAFLILAILIDVERHLLVLICISPVPSDGEHLFICASAISVFFSGELFEAFPHWKKIRLTLLLSSFKSSLCLLDNSPLSDVPLANIFSPSVASLLILLTASFSEQKILILTNSRVSLLLGWIMPFVYFKRS